MTVVSAPKVIVVMSQTLIKTVTMIVSEMLLLKPIIMTLMVMDWVVKLHRNFVMLILLQHG